MSEFDPQAIKTWLEQHDVRLRPAASATALARLRAAYGEGMNSALIRLYETFDGCDRGDFEARSFITIWPLAEALEHSREHRLGSRLAFADWCFSCDIAECDLSLPLAPVRWQGCKPNASSFAEFWTMFMRGDLDD